MARIQPPELKAFISVAMVRLFLIGNLGSFPVNLLQCNGPEDAAFNDL